MHGCIKLLFNEKQSLQVLRSLFHCYTVEKTSILFFDALDQPNYKGETTGRRLCSCFWMQWQVEEIISAQT